MRDTSPEMEERYRAMLLARSPEERFLMAIRSFDAARALVLASLPRGLTADELRRQLFARIYADMPPEHVPEELRLSAGD